MTRLFASAAVASIAVVCASSCTPLNGSHRDAGTGGGSPQDAAATGSGGSTGTGGAGTGGATSTGGAIGTGGVGLGGGGIGASGIGGRGTGGAGTGGAGTGGAGTGGAGTGGAGTGGTGTGGTGTGGTGTGGAGTGGTGGNSSRNVCALIMHMDETSWSGLPGEVVDSCGHNNGTAVKGADPSDLLPISTSSGHFGGAGLFHDSNGCVQASDDSSLHATTQLTMAAWIFPTAFNPNSNGIVAKRTDYTIDSSYAMFLWNGPSGGPYQLYADIGTERFNGNQVFSANLWYHVAVVFDGTLPVNQRVRLYVNGIQDGEFAENLTAIPGFPTSLYVGCLPLARPAQEFAGKIDEVAIWTRAIGAAEILQLFQSTAPL